MGEQISEGRHTIRVAAFVIFWQFSANITPPPNFRAGSALHYPSLNIYSYCKVSAWLNFLGAQVEFIAGGINKRWLRMLTNTHTPACTEVKAAIAYASSDNMQLLHACKDAGKILTFYGRYDEGVPVHPDIIKWFLDQASPNYVCRVVPDILHAKVIWWVGSGVYIGSANMTNRGWYSNMEVGTFTPHAEITPQFETELENFFSKAEKKSYPITQEFYRHLKRLADSRREVDKANTLHKARIPRFFPEGIGLSEEENVSTENKKFEDFQRDWAESLQFLRDIGTKVTHDQYRPVWIPEEIPEGAQVDQFIHAFYYQNIRGDRGIDLVRSANRENRLNPEIALVSAMKWWKQSQFDYTQEEKHLKEWAKLLRTSFERGHVRTMGKDQFIMAMSCVHAVREVARRKKNASLGLPQGKQDQETKIKAHLTQLWDAKSKEGVGIRELLDYVIWGNGPESYRIWNAVKQNRWHIPSIGFSTLGELLGWARPDEFPPRNNRTLKGLFALGFPISLPNDDDED